MHEYIYMHIMQSFDDSFFQMNNNQIEEYLEKSAEKRGTSRMQLRNIFRKKYDKFN